MPGNISCACGASARPRRRSSTSSRCSPTIRRRENMLGQSDRVSRQPDAADRRRQRHDAQFDHRRPSGAQPESRSEYDKLRQNPALDPRHGLRDHPLADAARPHAAHGAGGHRFQGPQDQEGRQGGDVVRLGQSRRGSDRARQRIHHRPRPLAPSRLVRLRHPPLHGQPRGRDAAAHPVGGNHEALPAHRGGRRAGARHCRTSCRATLRYPFVSRSTRRARASTFP